MMKSDLTQTQNGTSTDRLEDRAVFVGGGGDWALAQNGLLPIQKQLAGGRLYLFFEGPRAGCGSCEGAARPSPSARGSGGALQAPPENLILEHFGTSEITSEVVS